MAKDLLKILESAGFTGAQAKLYFAGLQLGSGPASEYARQAGLNRITAYNMLEEMARGGRFTLVKKTRGKWYAPVAPEYLAVEVRKNADALHRSLPELRSMQGPKERKPHVRFFEGWEGVRHVYDDTLRVHLRGIAPDDAAGRRVHGEDRKKLREIRLVSARDFDFTNEINIYDSKVAICSFASSPQMFGVIIESREVAETQRQIFEMAWRYAGRK
ncbi:hypothetical protein HYW84_00070 [Candidatus Peregrinibacteria bacterium]|nr:hypothetical protein [Candidatus Peregrinibacteria bacterium]